MRIQYKIPPRFPTGPDNVLHLKLYDGPNWTTAGPVLHAYDYSFNNHPGTLQGTATYKFPGVDFDGNSDYIEVADHADFTPALTPFSISAWCYMDSAGGFVIASKGFYNTDGEWQFQLSALKKVRLRFFDENADNTYIGRSYSVAITQSEWVHLVATYDGGTASSSCKIYLNGIQVDDADWESVNTATISNIIGDGATVTVTTSASHGFIIGNVITVTGTTNYNEASVAIASVPNATTFTYSSADTGTAETSGTVTGEFTVVENLTHAVWIGRYDTNYANGKIDDVLIYTRELSAIDIRNLYELTRHRYGV